MRRNFDKEKVRQNILERRDDQPDTQQILQVVQDRMKKCRRKFLIRKNRNIIFQSREVHRSQTRPFKKAEIDHVNDRKNDKTCIEYKTRENELNMRVFSSHSHSLSPPFRAVRQSRAAAGPCDRHAATLFRYSYCISSLNSSISSSTVMSPENTFGKSSCHTVTAVPSVE